MSRIPIVVSAPEMGITATLSGANLQIAPVRRLVLGANIDARAFDLRDVGHVPGCEQEYHEEHKDFGEDDITIDPCDDDTQDIDEDDTGSEPILVAGAPSDEEDDEEEAAAAGADEEKVMENLAADIGRAVHLSMLKSIRSTTVLSQTSKKKTMDNMNRIRQSVMNMDGTDDIQDDDLMELLNFQT